MEVDPAAHARAWRVLRQAPCAPAVARQLWEQVQRRAHARAGRRIAGHLASMALWTPAERARWRLRARPPRSHRPSQGSWRTRHLQAWIERDGGGAVLAQGEGVEQHALRRLAAEGWQGVHGEGGFWMALTMLLMAPVLASPVPGAWIGPLARQPLDWGRWGFCQRRRADIADVLLGGAADRVGVLGARRGARAERPWDRGG